MKDLSRRDFFKKCGADLTDQIDLGALKKVLAPSPSNAPVAEWVLVGRMAEFAPGIVREEKIGEVSLSIQSLAEGFWAERLDKPKNENRIALRTEEGGKVWANINIRWPNNRVLSHLTGQQADSSLRDNLESQENTNEPRKRP